MKTENIGINILKMFVYVFECVGIYILNILCTYDLSVSFEYEHIFKCSENFSFGFVLQLALTYLVMLCFIINPISIMCLYYVMSSL